MKSIILFCSSALLFFSCDDASEIELVNTLGTDVKVSMTEYFESDERTLSFKFLTQKDYPCINYRIKSDYQAEGQAINISLSEVQGADVCLEAIAPAASFIDLGELAFGDYPITIQIGESLVNTGTLSVTEGFFELAMNETTGLLIENSQILRIPKGMIWGYVRSAEPATAQSIAQNMVERMQSIGATVRMLPAGDYGYFAVDQAGNATLPHTESGSVFLLDYPGEVNNAAVLIEEAMNSLDEGVSISLRTTTGDELQR